MRFCEIVRLQAESPKFGVGAGIGVAPLRESIKNVRHFLPGKANAGVRNGVYPS